MNLSLLVHGKIHAAELVGGVLFVQRRLCADGRLRRQHRLIRFIAHPHLLRGLRGMQRGIRHHGSHIVAIVADPPGQNKPVLNIPVGRVQ